MGFEAARAQLRQQQAEKPLFPETLSTCAFFTEALRAHVPQDEEFRKSRAADDTLGIYEALRAK